MSVVSVTRARLRRPWSFPGFALSAMAAFRQAGAAEGFLGGAVLPDRRLTFWTLTVWRDAEAMRAYILSGAHGAAMPRFARWCDEASVVHWDQASDAVPPWPEAVARMRAHGRPSKLRRPSANHASLAFPDPASSFGGPIPRRS